MPDSGLTEPLDAAGGDTVAGSAHESEGDSAAAAEEGALVAEDSTDILAALDFNSEEPAASEHEIALLDELIALSLPDEAPRELSHEEALLHTRSELPLVLNSEVQRLLNYFTKTRRGTATIRVSMGRGSAYRPMIERILEEEGVPAELYYLAMAESGFQPKARSHAAATGMWQFIASRGKQYGLRRDRYADLRYDAETATRAAAKHLKDLYIEFNDWYLAMAAYNCGPNRVKSAIRRTGSRDFFTLTKRRALPRETRNYVPIILAMTLVGQNLDLFDIGEVDYAPEKKYDTVRTTTETSFALIADATRSSVETIKELNVALYRSATPPYAYDLRLPEGTAERFERELALVPPDKRLHWRRYEVRQGETIEAVAKRYKVDLAALLDLNSLTEGNSLTGGMCLTVPTTTRLSIYRYASGRGAGGLLEPGTGRYKIARGDTLGGIAGRFGTTVKTLMAWNGLASSRITAGRYLIVKPEGASGSVSPAPAPSGAAPNGRYTVRRGDSLSKIGARFGVSVRQLQSWNKLRGTTIRSGQTLRVPGRSTPSSPATVAAAPPSSGTRTSGKYRVRRGDSLAVIAKRHGISVQNLQNWNNLRGTRIYPGQALNVRAGSSPAPSAAPRAAASPPAEMQRYTVRRGDSLGAIAKRYGASVRDLQSWNSLRGTTIRTGQKLRVPGRGTPSSAAPTSSGTQTAGSYRVRSGDNLAVIAKRFGVSVPNLQAWNGLRGTRIYPGQTLVVRGGRQVASQRYTIRRGDTLDGIAKRFGVSVADLKRWNRLRSNRIQAGKTLVIQSSGTSASD